MVRPDIVAGWLRRLDPARAYALFSAYVTGLATLAAGAGYLIGTAVAGPALSVACATFAGVATGVLVMMAQPRTGPALRRDILTLSGAMVLAVLCGAITATVPAVGQPMLVAVAFAAFYVRRWGDPWAKAGLACLVVFVVHQIMGDLVPPGPLSYAAAPAVVLATAGWMLTPSKRFGRAVAVTARAVRDAVAAELHDPPRTPSAAEESAARIDALLGRVLAARDQADRFDAAAAPAHLALLHEAATMARIWENVADIVAKLATGRDAPAGAVPAVLSACAAVADALDEGAPEGRAAAAAALERIGGTVSTLAGTEAAGSSGVADALYDLTAAQLALDHLLAAADAFDRVLAGAREAGA